MIRVIILAATLAAGSLPFPFSRWFPERAPMTNWLNTDFQSRKSVTFADGSDLGVVRIKSDSSDFATARIDANDFRLTESDGTTRVDHEIIRYDSWLEADGIWTWYNDGSIRRHVGTKDATYIGFTTSDGQIKVGQYDHGNGSWTVGTLKTGLSTDDHWDPSVLVMDNGKILAAYSRNTDSFYRISSNVEDVESWETEQSLPDDGVDGYASLFQMSDGRIFWFFRRTFSGWGRWYRYSDDNGETWSDSYELLDNGAERPYTHIVQDGDKLHFSCTDGHPNEVGVASNNLYHFYFDYDLDGFYTTDGTLIHTRAQIEASDTLVPATDMTLIWDATGGNCWNWDIAVDANGDPVIAFVVFNSDTAPTDGTYYVAFWNGSSWDTHSVTNANGDWDVSGQPFYFPGITLDKTTPTKCWLGRLSGTPEAWNIYEYTVSTGGTVIAPSGPTSRAEPGRIKSGRPFAPVNAHPDMPVVWWEGRYDSFADFETKIVSPIRKYAELHIATTPDCGYIYFGKSDAGSSGEDLSGLYGASRQFVAYGALASPETVLGSEPDQYIPNWSGVGVYAAEDPGQNGFALEFGGSTLDTGTSIDGSLAGMTVAVSFRLDAAASGTCAMLGDFLPGTGGFIFRVDGTSNELQGYVHASTGQIGGDFADLTISRDTWHRAVLRFTQGTGIECWLDGVKSSTTYASAGTTGATNDDLMLGASPHNTSQRWTGEIEDVAVYSEAWSDDRIADDAAVMSDVGGNVTLGAKEGQSSSRSRDRSRDR